MKSGLHSKGGEYMGFIKLGISFVGIVLFWLASIGWAYVVKGEVTMENVESSALAFLIGLVIYIMVDRSIEE